MTNNIIEVSFFTKQTLGFCDYTINKINKRSSLFFVNQKFKNLQKTMQKNDFNKMQNILNKKIIGYRKSIILYKNQNIETIKKIKKINGSDANFMFKIGKNNITDQTIKILVVFDYVIYCGALAKKQKYITTKENKIIFANGLKIIKAMVADLVGTMSKY